MFSKLASFWKRNKQKQNSPGPDELNNSKLEWERLDLKNKKFPKWFQFFSLFVLAVVFYLIINNLYTAFTTEIPPFPDADSKSISEKELLELQEKLNKEKILSFKELKHRAMDSLVDNKLLTVDNIRIIDSIYPDSLCDCY